APHNVPIPSDSPWSNSSAAKGRHFTFAASTCWTELQFSISNLIFPASRPRRYGAVGWQKRKVGARNSCGGNALRLMQMDLVAFNVELERMPSRLCDDCMAFRNSE